ncbi:MAG: hypothetical protein M3Z10_03655 [Gemmatimonadota bacterium]|nr:hypothetical protein [Gemmatimonadota bacterium]
MLADFRFAEAAGYSRLRKVLRPFYLGGRKIPPVTVLAAYFDDSRREGVVSIAGYVAHLEMWDDRFAPGWQRIIHEAPHYISEFKASDCRNKRGEFEGWTTAECDALTTALVDVLTHHTDRDNFIGLGIAVRLPRVESVPGFSSMSAADKTSWRRTHFDESFQLCLQLILVEMLTTGAHLLGVPSDKLELVFDEQRKQVGKAWTNFDTIRKLVGAEVKYDVPVPSFRNSKDVLPLQAADLLTHETAREVINGGPPRSRPISIALSRLINARWHRAKYIDAKLLADYLLGGQTPTCTLPFFTSRRISLEKWRNGRNDFSAPAFASASSRAATPISAR